MGFPPSYAWHLTVLSFIVVGFIAVLTYNHTRRGSWLLLLLLSIPVARHVVRMVNPPWFTFAKKAHRPGFLICYLSALFTAYFLVYLGYGWMYFLLHASRSEMQENLDMLSIPLAWAFPQFLITPHRDFLDVLGVIMTNSLFYAMPMLICWRIARFVLKRNRVTQMGLSGSGIEDSDEE